MSSQDESANLLKQIVSQVKAGSKSREEAFNELLMLNNATTISESPDVPETVSSMDQQVASTAASIASLASSSRFSQEERMVLINKLIDKNNKNNNKGSISIDDRDDIESMGTTDNYQSDNSNIIPSRYTVPNDYLSTGGDNNYNNDNRFHEREAWTENDNYSPRRNDRQMNSYNNRSFDDSQIGNARYQRVAQTEASIRQEMFKEFTFKPNVKSLPSHYGTIKDKDTPFYQRVTKWQKERDLTIKNRKQDQSKNETSDCTFHPRINRNSERAIKEIRGDSKENVNDRLYKSNEVLYAQRAKYIEDELRREREHEDQECTFEPELKTKGKFNHVKSKLSNVPSRDYDASKDPELKKCTFTPKVNAIHRNMNSAQLYISTNVVDRLSRAPTAPVEPIDDNMRLFDITNNNDRPIMDMTSFMGSLGMGNDIKRSSSAPPKRPSLTTEELAKQKQNFQQFLGRQQITLITKEKKAEEMKRSSTPTFKPEFCRKSLEISNNIIKGEFLERVERDVLKRVENELTKTHTVIAMHPFTPAINKSSEKLRPRSAHEMSRGDQMRRETNQRMMRLRCEQKELSELTFQPEITKKAIKMGKTVLASKLSEDPSKIIEWARSEDLKKEESRLQQLKEKEIKELETCTFAPQTKDCPAYIKRIAKSMAVVKAARSSDQTSVHQSSSSKPTWK